jgi:CDP-4-dehydro-6-deoxyglucose reductase, E3
MPTMSGPLTATLSARAIIAPGIADLRFAMQSPATLRFRGGQFVSLSVDPSLPRRSYSIASQSDHGESVRLILRVIEGGPASAYLMAMPLGAPLAMTGPHGFFALEDQHPGDIVFAATGTGVAAVMPMLGELAARPTTGRRLLAWGLRHPEDIFARDEIEALCRDAGVELDIHLTLPPPGWSGTSGRITATILNQFPQLAAPTFYLVGNGAMIDELKRALVEKGVNRKRQIRTEAFFD